MTGRGLSVFAATEGVNRRPGTADDFEICIILRTLHFASGISARSAYVGNSILLVGPIGLLGYAILMFIVHIYRLPIFFLFSKAILIEAEID